MKTLMTQRMYNDRPSDGLSVKIIEPPNPVIGLNEVKPWMSIDHDMHDDDIINLMDAVRVLCQHHTGRAIGRQKIEAHYLNFRSYAVLPYPPHIEVEKVERYKNDQEWEEVDYTKRGTTQYTIRASSIFTLSGWHGNPVKVTYIAGENQIDENIKAAIKDTMIYCYDHRGQVQGDRGLDLKGVTLTPISITLLSSSRVYR